MAATIKDVARLAGCSIKTVSRVINEEPYVTSDLRARVQSAIRATGFAPNISARRLVKQQSYALCILMYPGFYQATSAVLSRIMDIGYEENYDILIQPYFAAHTRSRNKLVELIHGRRFDGYIVTPPCDADDFVADLLLTYKIPLVQINPFNRGEKIPFIAGDDEQGAALMTEHLLQLGHRRIAFLAGPRNMRSSFDRLHGYQAALAAHGVAYQPEWVEPTEFTFDGGYTAVRMLLERSDPALRPSAIFAGNDEAAYGALFAAQELGLQVPQQLSVCGYDDFSFSKFVWPGLTTIHQPAEDLLDVATHLLIRLVKGEPVDARQAILPPQLVLRGSTGPVAE
jgi:LacI family transcriptional regulator